MTPIMTVRDRGDGRTDGRTDRQTDRQTETGGSVVWMSRTLREGGGYRIEIEINRFFRFSVTKQLSLKTPITKNIISEQ